jgi:hypothetical protein
VVRFDGTHFQKLNGDRNSVDRRFTLTVKEILAKYQLPENQALEILKGLKIDKKPGDVLGPKHLEAVDTICQLVKSGTPLVEALTQVLDAARQKNGAIVASENYSAITSPHLPPKTVVSLQDYAAQVIPPDATVQFVEGALDGVDDVAARYSPSNGYELGVAIGQQVLSEIPDSEEKTRQIIEARLGERKARASA